MILVCALLLDLGAGEPRNFWHPVAWIGGVLDRLFRAAPRHGHRTRLLYGAAIVGGVALSTACLLSWAERPMASMGWLGVIAQAWLIKCVFSLRRLFSVAKPVERALAVGDLERARSEVGLHLVSRETSTKLSVRFFATDSTAAGGWSRGSRGSRSSAR